MPARRVRIQNIQSINDVYEFRLDELKEKHTAPKLILLSPQQREKIILETKLHEKYQEISNLGLPEFLLENKFILFGIEISTEELQRK